MGKSWEKGTGKSRERHRKFRKTQGKSALNGTRLLSEDYLDSPREPIYNRQMERPPQDTSETWLGTAILLSTTGHVPVFGHVRASVNVIRYMETAQLKSTREATNWPTVGCGC